MTTSNGSWSSSARLLHAHDDVAVHLDEPAVAIPGEALVVGGLDQRQHGLVVQAEVQNRVHHAGHRVARAGADRDQQRHRGCVAEFGAHDFFDVGDAVFDRRFEVLGAAFNRMARGLRERERERDMFGRVVSPEVREKLLGGDLPPSVARSYG